ncbi:MAG: hypothetical protein WCI67_15635, partial [Chloroflexales bacterium]
MLFVYGIIQLIAVVGGSLALALWALNRLFPPIERARDTRASVIGSPSRAVAGVGAFTLARRKAAPAAPAAPAA